MSLNKNKHENILGKTGVLVSRDDALLGEWYLNKPGKVTHLHESMDYAIYFQFDDTGQYRLVNGKCFQEVKS